MRAGMETGPPAFGAGEFRRFVSEDRFEATGTSMSWQVGGDAAIRAASCWRLGSEGPGKMDGVPQSWGKCCQQLGCDVGDPLFFQSAGPEQNLFRARRPHGDCPLSNFQRAGAEQNLFRACRFQGECPTSSFQGTGSEQIWFQRLPPPRAFPIIQFSGRRS